MNYDDFTSQFKSANDLVKYAQKHKLYKGKMTEGKLDLDGLCKIFDFITLQYKMLEYNYEAGYVKYIEDKWILAVNKAHSKNRQRFTIAHELGHLVLHAPEHKIPANGIVEYTRNDIRLRDSKERDADRFAADLLMPEKIIDNKFNNKEITDITDFAYFFAVSQHAMEVRLFNLGYKTKNPIFLKYK